MSIDVLKPGAFTTFQDLGRVGRQHIGVPVGGVMDERSHRFANMLVGNPASEATLEVTLLGPTLHFRQPAVIAICGADLGAALDDQPLPPAHAAAISAGEVLSFGKYTSGLRAYIAAAGGYALEPVMGSTSTYVRGGFGGIHGRPLQKGDCIDLRHTKRRPVPKAALPVFPVAVQRPHEAPIRLMPGRERDAFLPAACATLSEHRWRINPRSDRMGYRLDGPQLALQRPLELQSEPVEFGAVQVPPDGLPIILTADRQTTGGYPRIASVATADLPRLAQYMPGETVCFEWVTLKEAQHLAVSQAVLFKRMEASNGYD
jgi:antagonist of KipI